MGRREPAHAGRKGSRRRGPERRCAPRAWRDRTQRGWPRLRGAHDRALSAVPGAAVENLHAPAREAQLALGDGERRREPRAPPPRPPRISRAARRPSRARARRPPGVTRSRHARPGRRSARPVERFARERGRRPARVAGRDGGVDGGPLGDDVGVGHGDVAPLPAASASASRAASTASRAASALSSAVVMASRAVGAASAAATSSSRAWLTSAGAAPLRGRCGARGASAASCPSRSQPSAPRCEGRLPGCRSARRGSRCAPRTTRRPRPPSRRRSGRRSHRASGPRAPAPPRAGARRDLARRARGRGSSAPRRGTRTPAAPTRPWPRRPRRGARSVAALDTIGEAGLSADSGRMTSRGAPWRTVPRTITSVASVAPLDRRRDRRRLGGAASAAICAGERICRAARPPAVASATMHASATTAIRILRCRSPMSGATVAPPDETSLRALVHAAGSSAHNPAQPGSSLPVHGARCRIGDTGAGAGRRQRRAWPARIRVELSDACD